MTSSMLVQDVVRELPIVNFDRRVTGASLLDFPRREPELYAPGLRLRQLYEETKKHYGEASVLIQTKVKGIPLMWLLARVSPLGVHLQRLQLQEAADWFATEGLPRPAVLDDQIKNQLKKALSAQATPAPGPQPPTDPPARESDGPQVDLAERVPEPTVDAHAAPRGSPATAATHAQSSVVELSPSDRGGTQNCCAVNPQYSPDITPATAAGVRCPDNAALSSPGSEQDPHRAEQSALDRTGTPKVDAGCDTAAPSSAASLPSLQREMSLPDDALEIKKTIETEPGITSREIGEKLDRSDSDVRYYINRYLVPLGCLRPGPGRRDGYRFPPRKTQEDIRT